MQNNTTTKEQAVRDHTQDNAPGASGPAGKPKSYKGLAVEELADYYANSKPPGRRYPVSMAADMLNNYIAGVAGDPPVIENSAFSRVWSLANTGWGRLLSLQEEGPRQLFFEHAPAKGSAMELLNIDSTPDGPSTKSSSASPIKPVGSDFSSPSRQALLKDGPAFSIDTDPNIAESGFVLSAWFPLNGFRRVGLIESCVYAADDASGCFALYCRCDDLRAASVSMTMFESALTTVSFTFVDHHEYFGHDHTNARAQAVSAYEGQVEFTASPKSMLKLNVKNALRKPCYDFYFL
ncbi:hypothetical protein KCU77_g196, partial [Aureobasidium melanogenum]